MAIPALQKYLGWVQRFLYNIEVGQIPFPQPVININHDWPLDTQTRDAAYATIAGSVLTDIVVMGSEQHGWVTHLGVIGINPFPVTDLFQLRLTFRTNDQIELIRYQSFSVTPTHVPLIGTKGKSGAEVQLSGITPVYMPPGSTLTINHQSVAGGVNAVVDCLLFQRDKFLPLAWPR